MSTPESPTIEAPDFNGMSQEAFLAGTGSLDLIRNLPRDARVEVRPQLVRHTVYEALGDECSPAEIEELLQAAREAVLILEHSKVNAEAKDRPMELRPDEY